jgi:hypothetical protein
VTCCVGPCPRPAIVAVRFEPYAVSEWAYCEWHGFSRGVLRWHGWQVAASRMLR